jgi:hypothetical protein
MGKFTPLLKLLYEYVPGFNLFRGSSKWIFISAFSLSVLSGFGADIISKNTAKLRNKKTIMFILSIIILLSGAIAVMLIMFDISWFKGAVLANVNSAEFRNLLKSNFTNNRFAMMALYIFRLSAIRTIALLIYALSVFILFYYKKINRKILLFSFASIIIIDLFSFGMRYMITFDSRLSIDAQITDILRSRRQPNRAIILQRNVNAPVLSKIQTPAGYDALTLKRYSEFINMLQGVPKDTDNLYMQVTRFNKFTDMLNVKFLIMPAYIIKKEIDTARFKQIYADSRYTVYENLQSLPRAFIAYNTSVINNEEKILEYMQSDDFDPLRRPVVESEIPAVDNNLSGSYIMPAGDIEFVEYGPNRVVLNTYLEKPGLLVLNDVYYQKWKAKVDGKDKKVYEVNYIMRGVVMPKGKHSVIFYYDTKSFIYGCAISIITLITLLGILLIDKKYASNTPSHKKNPS